MKRAVRRAVDLLGAVVSRKQVWWFGRRHRGPVTVLDIDNTLADAWPSFLEEWPSERDRLRGLRLLPGMKAAAYDAAPGAVMFLSHRNWWEWSLTRNWLRQHGMVGVLVLVASPTDKVRHLSKLASGRSVTYWDDLSHGTERGETEVYAEVIDAVAGLGIEWHGLDEIDGIVASAGGR